MKFLFLFIGLFLTLYLSKSFAKAELGIELDIRYSHAQTSDHREILEAEIPNFSSTSPEGQNFQAFKESFLSEYPVDYQNIALIDLSTMMMNFSEDRYHQSPNRSLLISEIVKDKVLHSSGSLEAKNHLNQARELLSFEQKVYLVSSLGLTFKNDYNTERASDGISNKEVVTFDDMLKAHQNGELGGVCRDIATGQAEIMRALGVEQAFVISYAMRDGAHATMIAMDPTDPTRAVKFNYGQITETNSSDPSALLRQDHNLPGQGIKFTISDHQGRPLTTIPSELGVMLEEAVGGDLKDMDPLLRSDHRMARARIQRGNFELFAVGLDFIDESDQDLMGLGMTYTNSLGERGYDRISLGGFHETKNGVVIDSEQNLLYVSLASRRFYSLYQTETSVGKIQIKASLKLNARGMFGQVSENRSQNQANEGIVFDTDISAAPGGVIQYQNTEGNLGIDLGVDFVTGVEKEDIRNADPLTSRPYLKHVVVSLYGEYQVTDKFTIYGDGILVYRGDELGAQYRSSGGLKYQFLEDKAVFFQVGQEGSLIDGPGFVPGAIEKSFVDVGLSQIDRWNIYLRGSCLTEDCEENMDFYLGAKLKF